MVILPPTGPRMTPPVRLVDWQGPPSLRQAIPFSPSSRSIGDITCMQRMRLEIRIAPDKCEPVLTGHDPIGAVFEPLGGDPKTVGARALSD